MKGERGAVASGPLPGRAGNRFVSQGLELQRTRKERGNLGCGSFCRSTDLRRSLTYSRLRNTAGSVKGLSERRSRIVRTGHYHAEEEVTSDQKGREPSI